MPFLFVTSVHFAARSVAARTSFCAKRPRVPSSSTVHSLRCSASESEQPNQKHEKRQSSKVQTHVSPTFAIESINQAISNTNNDLHSVAKLCARGFVQAFVQCYNQDQVTCIFVVCGHGFNGLIGLYSAVELKQLGYFPSVYSVQPNRYGDVSSICEQHGIDVYDFIPSTLEFQFQAVVDALLGLGYDGEDIRPYYWRVYEMLVSTPLPIASVDVPSGWDLEKGPRRIDFTADTFVKPHLLVSLGVPKNGVKTFAGEYHFLGGRHLEQEYFEERGVRVPRFPLDADCVLISTNPFPFRGLNGEIYGTAGFGATLYTKNPKREWVDVEEDMELWDELD